MYIEVMSLCDAATEAQGKLNILGTLSSPRNYPQCVPTAQWR